MSKAKLTFLGSGTSQGVPMIGCDCPVCAGTDPRDKRLRASVLVEYEGLTFLIDAGPDFRYQMLRSNIRHIDAILLTHSHKDHVGGIDDVRSFNLLEHKPIRIYCQDYVEKALHNEIGYAFAEPKYPGVPEIHVHTIDPQAESFRVWSNQCEDTLQWVIGTGYVHTSAGLPLEQCSYADIVPIQFYHDRHQGLQVLGYRFGNIAYLTDINLIEDEEIEKLKGVEYVTLGCVKMDRHYSHPSVQDCLGGAADLSVEEIMNLPFKQAVADLLKSNPQLANHLVATAKSKLGL